MKFMRQLFLLSAVIGMVGVGSSAALAAEPVIAKAAPKDLILKGDAKCTSCHDEADDPKLLSIAVTRHGVKGDSRTPTCTGCHGESEKHVQHKGSDKPPKPEMYFSGKSTVVSEDRSALCISCHKGEQRTRWDGSQHAVNDVACTSCHKVHVSHDKVRGKKTQSEVCFACHKSERAQIHKMSTHPIEAGKIACSDCHNVHGSAGPKMLKKNTLNETCYTCHAEKRGPFLFEHRPAVEDCSACHMPHGSNLTPLLKTRAPFMCQECHDGTHSSASPVGPSAAGRQVGYTGSLSAHQVGAGCLNCHRQIHGSNSPAGGYLQR